MGAKIHAKVCKAINSAKKSCRNWCNTVLIGDEAAFVLKEHFYFCNIIVQ